ncbi:MAG TPA: phosphoribosyltransferase family protein [Phycisphaerae bacterium]|nr:phosphoribosyltransferase family protein [Phycisphaerae bacterium]
MAVLRAVMRPIVDTVFPPTCWAEPRLPAGRSGLSEKALKAIGLLAAQRYCRRCGLGTGPFEQAHGAGNPCGRCGQRVTGVRATARVGVFAEPLVTLVHRLKFGKSWEVARVIAPFLRHAIEEVSREVGTPVEALAPVPLHWWRRARRGFNQAEELARETAGLGDWCVATPLKRVRRTAEQALLDSPTRRQENLRGAFVARPDRRVAGKHVWLVDDVSTTGATLRAATAALKRLPQEWRPASINAAVLCITDHDAPPLQMPDLDDH